MTAAVGVALIGCTSAADRGADAKAGPDRAAAQAADAPNVPAPNDTSPALKVVQAEIDPPGVLSGVQVKPLSGKALDRATTPLRELHERLTLPEPVRSAVPADDANRPANEPAPAEAVKHYIAGRDAYQQTDYQPAIQRLKRAIEADPNAAQVYELLGRVYVDAGESRRGLSMMYKALERDPNLPVALFLTGRVAYESEDWPQAAALLARARQVDRRKDPGLQYAATYYLGQSLLRLGYDAPAVELLAEYLREPERFTRSTRMYRQVALLGRKRGSAALQCGDASLRLGRADEALRYYDEAEQAGRVSRIAMDSRRIYLRLLTGEPERAVSHMLDHLKTADVQSGSIELTGYVADHAADRNAFVKAVQRLYRDGNRPADLARAVVAAMGDDPQAAAFALAHVRKYPDHVEVFAEIVERWREDKPERLAQAAIQLIGEHDTHARVYAKRLQQAGSTEKWRDLLSRKGVAPDNAARAYLQGRLAMAAESMHDAGEHFQRALDLNPDMLSAQIGAIEADLAMGRYEQAAQTLSSLAEVERPRVLYLRAMAEFGRGRHDKAITIMEKLLQREPRHTEYLLTLARFQRSAQPPRYDAAEQTLKKLLGVDARYEPAYAMLFQMYERDRPSARKYTKLLARARKHIPNSRVTRFNMARLHAARGEFDEAERILRVLVSAERRDPDALQMLVSVLGRRERWGEAYELLADVMKGEKVNPAALRLFRKVCRRTDRMDDYYRLGEKYLSQRDPTLSTLLMLAQIRQQQDRHAAALEALDKAVEEHGHRTVVHRMRTHSLEQLGRHDQAIEALNDALAEGVDNRTQLLMTLARTLAISGRIDRAVNTVDHLFNEQGVQMPRADLYYQLAASMYGDEGAGEAAEQILLRALEVDPDHAPSLNNLAYAWAEDGRNLERAEKMLRKAVSAEGDNAAYLDSLGWVFYKQGEFDKAVQWLQRAREAPGGEDPIIVDHLGDALWRAGKTERAAERWRDALRGLEASGDNLGAEHRRAAPRIQAKLRAVEAEKKPELAPLPDEPAETSPAAGDDADSQADAAPNAPAPEPRPASSMQ